MIADKEQDCFPSASCSGLDTLIRLTTSKFRDLLKVHNSFIRRFKWDEYFKYTYKDVKFILTLEYQEPFDSFNLIYLFRLKKTHFLISFTFVPIKSTKMLIFSGFRRRYRWARKNTQMISRIITINSCRWKMNICKLNRTNKI